MSYFEVAQNITPWGKITPKHLGLYVYTQENKMLKFKCLNSSREYKMNI